MVQFITIINFFFLHFFAILSFFSPRHQSHAISLFSGVHLRASVSMKRLFEVYAKKKGEASSSLQIEVPQVEPSPHFANEREQTVDFETLQADPGKRKQISEFHPDIQDDVRRSYLKKGPHHPRNYNFPWTVIGNIRRRFNLDCYDRYGVGWLEYSIHDDKVYCLPCYLFKNVLHYGGAAFVSVGFKDWNNPARLGTHINDSCSSHRDCVHKCHDLMNPKQSITHALNLTLQRCDQDLLNALSLIKVAKERLQEMRNKAWEELLSKVVTTCNKVVRCDIIVVRCDPDFKELRGLSDLSVQLVKTNKCNTFSVVYKLVKLALLLPVATASVERVFSAMNHVKSDKSSTMDDQWLNDRLVTYLERDVLNTISNAVILAHFQEFDRRFSL